MGARVGGGDECDGNEGDEAPDHGTLSIPNPRLRRTRYWVIAFETSHVDVEARTLAAALPDGARVLDAGCGRTTRLGSFKNRISELVGVDVDAQAGEENEALDRFVVADLCSPLPFEDASFDLVYANFVVEHLADPDAAFREWRRVLRSGGSLVLLTSNQANPVLAAARLLPWRARLLVKRSGAGVAERDVIPTHYRANTPRRLAALAARTGFAARNVAYVAGLHRYAVRLRPLALALLGLERLLPPRLRATMVGHYSAA